MLGLSNHAKTTLLCFLLLWGAFGALINVHDGTSFTLQHAGTQALVEYQTFELGLTDNRRLKHPGDTFEFEGRLLAAKQPGQFVLGAIPYSLLHSIGISYDTNYNLTAALTTWLSVSLFLSLSLVCFYHLLHSLWSFSRLSSVFTTFLLAFGTILLPYSGVLHHDSLACAFLLISLFACELSSRKNSLVYSFVAGFCCAFAVFISMLAALTAPLIALRYLVKFTGMKCVTFLLALSVPLLGLGAYNLHYFGSPFVMANVAGDWSDTFFAFDLFTFLDHLRIYYGAGELSIWAYMPIVVPAFLGLLLGLKSRPGMCCFALCAILVNAGYVLNISTIGHCQYGPRYLIQVVPFFLLGLPLFLETVFPGTLLSLLKVVLLSASALLSVFFQLIGSLGGTMYCDIVRFGVAGHLEHASAYGWPELPLLTPSLTLIAFSLILLSWTSRPLLKTLLGELKEWRNSHLVRARSLPLPASPTICFVVCALFVALAYIFSNRFFYSPYDYTVRIGEAFFRGQLGLDAKPPGWLNEFIPLNGSYYSVFPLGSVITVLPLSFLRFIGYLSEVPSFLIVSALAVAVFAFTYLISARYRIELEHRLALSLSLCVGTWMWANVAFGGSWQLALGFALLGQLGAIYFSIYKPKPFWCGVFFALAFGNRTEVILTAPVYLYLLGWPAERKEGNRSPQRRPLFLFCVIPFLLGVLTLLYNYARFGSLFDFGYARIPGVLFEPWYEDGIFSFGAIGQNAWQMLLAPWRILDHRPYLVPSGFGGSIFLSSPFLVYLFQPNPKSNQVHVRLAWISIALMTVVLFLHGNPGGWQFSYRYAMVLLPWIYVLLFEKASRSLSFTKASLIIFSVLANGYATWLFYWTDYVQP